MTKEIDHEYQFYTWFNEEYAPSFTSKEGLANLEEHKEEIMGSIDAYFTPRMFDISDNCKYLQNDVIQVREAYKSGDLASLANALDDFKSSCQWV